MAGGLERLICTDILFCILCISQEKKINKCKIFMRNRSNFVLTEPEFNRACTQIVVFARMAREWLCTASTSTATCSGGVNWLMP